MLSVTGIANIGAPAILEVLCNGVVLRAECLCKAFFCKSRRLTCVPLLFFKWQLAMGDKSVVGMGLARPLKDDLSLAHASNIGIA